MFLPQPIVQVITRIQSAGYQAFAVGGCVRDSLMGKEPSDWDIATSAPPQDVLDIFSKFKTILTGIKHGTVTVFIGSIPIEITTFRIDGSYKDNRHPADVIFSNNIAEDLKRRDFTVNAMAYNPSEGLIDLHGGLEDIRQGIIRAVGNPETRFREDALRIMRAIRFSATLGFEIEPATNAAIFACSNLLENIAAERIALELDKIITAEKPAPILSQFFSVLSGTLFHHPVTESNGDFEPLNRSVPYLNVRLTLFILCAAKLLGLSPSDTGKRLLSRLKYSNRIHNFVMICLENIDLNLTDNRISLRKCLHNIGVEPLKCLISVKSAIADIPNMYDSVSSEIQAILDRNDCLSVQNLAVKGFDLISIFKLSGKDVGNALNLLLDAVMEERCQNNYNALIDYYSKKG